MPSNSSMQEDAVMIKFNYIEFVSGARDVNRPSYLRRSNLIPVNRKIVNSSTNIARILFVGLVSLQLSIKIIFVNSWKNQ